jgi:hypothetical protein
MSTPAHAIVNLLLFRRARALPVALGAIAPDVPMFFFYALEKLVLARRDGPAVSRRCRWCLASSDNRVLLERLAHEEATWATGGDRASGDD